MKHLISVILGTLALVLSAGCSSTTITETTYAEDGKTIVSQKVTKTSESPVVVAVGNTKNKHVVFHNGGFYANVGFQPNNNSYGIGLGTVDNTYASIVASDGTKDGKDVAKQFAKIVNASKYKLSVSTDGVNSENSENETISATKKTETKGN